MAFIIGGLLLHEERVTAAPSIDDYGNLPQVELMRVSPSGNHIALIGVDHGKRQLGLDAKAPWAVFDHSDDIEHSVFGFEGTFPEQ